MVRFCRACQKSKPYDEFDPNGYCRMCVRAGRRPRAVNVQLPPGWKSPYVGLPDMTIPSPTEIEEGYDGDLWTAHRDQWRLEVRWRGDQALYHCTALERGQLSEELAFDYPHEVVDWISRWFVRAGPQAVQL